MARYLLDGRLDGVDERPWLSEEDVSRPRERELVAGADFGRCFLARLPQQSFEALAIVRVVVANVEARARLSRDDIRRRVGNRDDGDGEVRGLEVRGAVIELQARQP